MKVMVLAGGPDRERAVSLRSGAQVAAALRVAGHDVRERDMGPEDLAALEEFARWTADGPDQPDAPGNGTTPRASDDGELEGGNEGGGGGGVVFPVFHGKWGEGGGCQALLEAAGVAFVGCGSEAARRCFDKAQTKRLLEARGLPTPAWELVAVTDRPTLEPPVVIKPVDEGSSIDLRLCPDAASLGAAWSELAGSGRHGALLVERLIRGRELTVGVVVGEGNAAADAATASALNEPRDEAGNEGGTEGGGGGVGALPVIRIVPATEFYDYQAKYERDDTRYEFDAVDPAIEAQLRHLATQVFTELGCRHLARVDLFLDADDRPWVIEVNTLPGFTDHSLMPRAARHAGLAMPALVDRLVRAAAAEHLANR